MIRTNATKGVGIAFACLAGALLCLASPALADGTGAAGEASYWEELKSYFFDMLPGKATKVKGAYTRGEEEVVILADPYREEESGARPCKLTAGKRALHIRWQGGEAPYRLHLLKKEGEGMRMLVETSADVRAADLPALDLEPGDYLLVIKDAKDYAQNVDPLAGPATTMDLNVLPVEERPVISEDFAADAPEAMRALRYPIWLANRGDGEWTLEAMQLAAPLAAESPYAAAWMRQWGGQ